MRYEVDRRVAGVAGIVYFLQGAIGIASIALPLYLRAQGFSITKISLLSSIASIPWFLKIVYGAISDAVPIWGMRRKSYLLICGVISFGGWFLLGTLPPLAGSLIVSMMLANLGLAAMDVVTDGLVVERSDGENAQRYQSISWGARSGGALVSGVIGGWMAATMPHRLIFVITGLLSFLALGAVLFLKEEIGPARRSVIRSIVDSIRLLFRGDLLWLSLLLLIAGLPASLGIPFFFYMYENLGFDEVFMGLLTSVGWFGAMVGCFLFVRFFRGISLKKSLFLAVVLSFIQVLMLLLIRGHASAFLVVLTGGVLAYVTLLPFMTAAARLTHGTGLEGALFAMLMSLYNFSQVAAKMVGGFLYDKMGISLLIVLTAAAGAVSLVMIPRLKTLE